eukprot:TRINITY_DN38700_c0_g1_i2.p1 TRINITY_DN38700_c0_g1~~TRINITY_DN38700_c0_g1_i2.p1  ORF type:complete len:185 (+),score=48.43 TRINITY_DN38700_c0_g1_i2:103-657(+)
MCIRDSSNSLPKSVFEQPPEHALHTAAHENDTAWLERLWRQSFSADGSDTKDWWAGKHKEQTVYSSDKAALEALGVSDLQEHEFNVNWKDDRSTLAGDTALHTAVRMNNYDAVEMLVNNFLADKEIKNGEGKDALQLAMFLASGAIADSNPKIMAFLAEGTGVDLSQGFQEKNRFMKDGVRQKV